ncbi:MAG: 2-amino-4-hydroxy-6-hydroxymethyldihydropteridine diphosphokinase [Bacillota bacterium]
MTDRIILTGMRFYGYHGVFPEEAKLGQAFSVDVELLADLREAGEKDDIRKTIDYGKVYQTVKSIVEGDPFKLIEALAENVAEEVLREHHNAREVVVRVHKPKAPIPGPIDGITVEIRRKRVARAYLSLGSNVGDRLGQLAESVRRLERVSGVRLVAVSGVYETAPQGKTDQPEFLNAVVAIDTDLDALALLEAIHKVERRMGRIRAERWGPRTIDLDILLYGAQAVKLPGLTVPHPRMGERAFVLIPLLELLEGAGVRPTPETAALRRMLEGLPDQGVRPHLDGASFLRRIQGVE